MKVIENAFAEGRETDTKWEKSKAKRDSVRMDTFLNNIDNFNGRKINRLIPLEQVCPDTGKVLRSFGSRLDAARWIVANVLKLDDPESKKAISITGNMHMCMALGYKSYGFHWRAITEASHTAKLLEASKKIGSRPVFVLDNRSNIVKQMSYASIAEASKATGISERQIRRNLDNNCPVTNGFAFHELNSRLKTLTFDNLKLAANFFGTKPAYIGKMSVSGSTINNIKIVLTEKPKELVKVYRGRKLLGTFADAAKAARHLGVARTTITRSIQNDRLINGLYRCVRVSAKIRNNPRNR